MSIINLPRSGYTSEELGDRVIVHIPSRKHWLQIVVISFWLVFWVFGWTGTATRNIGNRSDLVLLVWLVVWVIGGFAAIGSLLWQLAGEVVLEADRYALRVRWQISEIGWTKAYVASDVCNLRVRPLLPGRYRFSGWGSGLITFDYQGKIVCLSAGVNEVEAGQVVQMIQQYFLHK